MPAKSTLPSLLSLRQRTMQASPTGRIEHPCDLPAFRHLHVSPTMPRRACLAGLIAFVVTMSVAVECVRAELPNPVLNVVFPAGVRAGDPVTVTVEGAALDGLRGVYSTAPGLTAEKLAGNQFRVSVGAETPPGSTICGPSPIMGFPRPARSSLAAMLNSPSRTLMTPSTRRSQ